VNFYDYSVFLSVSFQHLKQDRVSIFALQDASSSLKETLQNPKSSIEDRALSRFSHQSFIQLEVNKYREKNPHWKLQIPVLLEKSKEKRKQIDKKLKEREAAKLAKKEPNTKKAAQELEVIQKDSSSSATEDEESDEEGEQSSSSEVEDKKKKLDIPDDDDKVQLPRTVVVQKSLSLLEKTPLEKQPKKKASLLAKTNKPPAVVVKPQLEKSKGTIRVQVLHNLSDIEQESIIIPSAPQPTDIKLTAEDPDKVSRKRPKSSFFVGGVDEEEEPEDQERPPQQRQRQRQFQSSSSFSGPPAEFKPIFRKGKLVNKGPKRFTQSQPQDRRRPKERYFDSSSEQFGGSSNLTPLGDNKKEGNNNKKQFVKSSSKSLFSNPAAANSEHSSGDKLHPSWEAKKRQQISLSSFKGKKITFDD
jgi:hypothetical protein